MCFHSRPALENESSSPDYKPVLVTLCRHHHKPQELGHLVPCLELQTTMHLTGVWSLDFVTSWECHICPITAVGRQVAPSLVSVLLPRFQSWSMVDLKYPDYSIDFISDSCIIKIFYRRSKKNPNNSTEVR